MKIEIPKVLVAIPLDEYAPELNGKFLHVWVNPPMEKLQRYQTLVQDLQVRELERAKTQFEEPEPAETVPALAKLFEVFGRYVKAKTPRGGVDEALLSWYADLWSQGTPETQWSVEELRTLEAQDPSFLSWMISATWAARAEHGERKKKS